AAYYLYVGTAPGLKDLIDTGEIQSTSYQPAAPLPPGTPLYARIFTEYGASWYHPYADVQFSINSAIPQITYPKNGGVNLDMTQPVQWLPIPNADAYSVTVGTTLGGADVYASGQLSSTALVLPVSPPVGPTLYLRVGAHVSGAWNYTDASFTAALTFSFPVAG